jgi:hypothetical protein
MYGSLRPASSPPSTNASQRLPRPHPVAPLVQISPSPPLPDTPTYTATVRAGCDRFQHQRRHWQWLSRAHSGPPAHAAPSDP